MEVIWLDVQLTRVGAICLVAAKRVPLPAEAISIFYHRDVRRDEMGKEGMGEREIEREREKIKALSEGTDRGNNRTSGKSTSGIQPLSVI